MFDWTCSLQEGAIVIRLITDLPAGTRLGLHVTRPSKGYIWTNIDDRISTHANDTHSEFELVQTIDELDKRALNKYRHWKGRFPSQIDGVPEDSFDVRLVLNALEHQFGVCNRDLTGSQIQIRKNGHWIDRQISVPAPISNWLPDALP